VYFSDFRRRVPIIVVSSKAGHAKIESTLVDLKTPFDLIDRWDKEKWTELKYFFTIWELKMDDTGTVEW
jgi:hypothetical protein